MKPSIRKQDGCWRLTRPGYGFAPEPVVTDHESWKAARAALVGPAPAAAGSSAERGHYSLVQFNARGGWRGTIRMEDT